MCRFYTLFSVLKGHGKGCSESIQSSFLEIPQRLEAGFLAAETNYDGLFWRRIFGTNLKWY